MSKLETSETTENTISLMTLVVGAANSAKAAQDLMGSSSTMGIERFRIRFNIACTLKSAEEEDIKLSQSGANSNFIEKFTMDQQLGFGLDFTIKDQGIISAEASFGKEIADKDLESTISDDKSSSSSSSRSSSSSSSRPPMPPMGMR